MRRSSRIKAIYSTLYVSFTRIIKVYFLSLLQITIIKSNTSADVGSFDFSSLIMKSIMISS